MVMGGGRRRSARSLARATGYTNLTFLVARELLQVRIGKHHIELCFDGEVAIDLKDEMSLDQKTYLFGIAAGAALLDLIGSTIRVVDIPGRGDLVLTFDSGRRLAFHDSKQDFESYQIRGGWC
jgi:hypothetical protein